MSLSAWRRAWPASTPRTLTSQRSSPAMRDWKVTGWTIAWGGGTGDMHEPMVSTPVEVPVKEPTLAEDVSDTAMEVVVLAGCEVASDEEEKEHAPEIGCPLPMGALKQWSAGALADLVVKRWGHDWPHDTTPNDASAGLPAHDPAHDPAHKSAVAPADTPINQASCDEQCGKAFDKPCNTTADKAANEAEATERTDAECARRGAIGFSAPLAISMVTDETLPSKIPSLMKRSFSLDGRGGVTVHPDRQLCMRSLPSSPALSVFSAPFEGAFRRPFGRDRPSYNSSDHVGRAGKGNVRTGMPLDDAAADLRTINNESSVMLGGDGKPIPLVVNHDDLPGGAVPPITRFHFPQALCDVSTTNGKEEEGQPAPPGPAPVLHEPSQWLCPVQPLSDYDTISPRPSPVTTVTQSSGRPSTPSKNAGDSLHTSHPKQPTASRDPCTAPQTCTRTLPRRACASPRAAHAQARAPCFAPKALPPLRLPAGSHARSLVCTPMFTATAIHPAMPPKSSSPLLNARPPTKSPMTMLPWMLRPTATLASTQCSPERPSLGAGPRLLRPRARRPMESKGTGGSDASHKDSGVEAMVTTAEPQNAESTVLTPQAGSDKVEVVKSGWIGTEAAVTTSQGASAESVVTTPQADDAEVSRGCVEAVDQMVDGGSNTLQVTAQGGDERRTGGCGNGDRVEMASSPDALAASQLKSTGDEGRLPLSDGYSAREGGGDAALVETPPSRAAREEAVHSRSRSMKLHRDKVRIDLQKYG